MKRNSFILLMVLIMAFALAGCGGHEADGESVNVGQTWTIANDDPLDGGNAWALTSHGIGEYVFMQEPDGTAKSRYVKNLEPKSDTEWLITLKEDAKFADGSPVDAKALSGCLNEIQEKNKLSNASAGKIKYTPTGEYAIAVQTERPTKDLKAILGEWTNIVFKKDGDKYIFSGPFKIKSLEPEDEVILEPNENYPDSKRRPKAVRLKSFKDINALLLAYESGKLDLAYGITGEMAQKLQEKGKKVLNFDAGYQYFTFLNLKNDILKDPAVRAANDKAIDREDIKKALGGGTLPTGLFAHYNSFDAREKAPYDPEKAASLLSEAGWTMPEGGKYRVKDGRQLALKIKTYSAKPDLPIVSQTIASNLEKVGVKASVELVDDISKVTKDKDFDVLVYAQHPSPSGSPVYFLNQFFRTKAPYNFTSYSSPQTDEILDAMGKSAPGEKLDALAIKAQENILRGRPVLLTLDPTWHAAVSEKLKDYKIWNGDYYIINATLLVK